MHLQEGVLGGEGGLRGGVALAGRGGARQLGEAPRRQPQQHVRLRRRFPRHAAQQLRHLRVGMGRQGLRRAVCGPATLPD